MIVNVDLDDLKTQMTYDDGYFKKDGYNISISKAGLDMFEKYIHTISGLFFQNEVTLDKNILIELNLDYTSTIYELIHLLYSNVEKAIALQKTINIPFSDIIDEGNDIFKDVNENGYILLYDKELMDLAREYLRSQVRDTPLEDLLGDDNLQFYMPEIDTKKLVELIKQKVENEDLNFDISTYETDEDTILAYSKEFEDIITIIEDNNLFNYESHVNGYIATAGDAVSSLEGIYGDFLGSQFNKIDNIRPQEVNIFRYDI